MLPNAFHVRHEAGHDQDIQLAAAVGLIRQMHAGTLDIACGRSGIDQRRCGAHQRVGRGFGRNPKLVMQPPCQGRVVPFCRTSVAGQQQAADQIPAIHLAQRIELDQASGMSGRGKMIAGGIAVLHKAFQRVHEPPPQRLAAIEHPIVELGAISQREAGEEVGTIEPAGLFEIAAVAGALEQMRVDRQFDRRRPAHAGAVGFENGLAERKLDAMKRAAQSRAGGVARALRPQQRGHDVPCNGAAGLRKIDQQRKTLAQVQLDRVVVAEDLREPERLKREPGHDTSPCPVGAPGDAQGTVH